MGGTGRTLPDVTGSDSLLLKVRSSTPDYEGFKIAFSAPGVPSTTIFQRNGAYKTEFYLANTADWQIVEVPLGNFSRDTSDYTGPVTQRIQELVANNTIAAVTALCSPQ